MLKQELNPIGLDSYIKDGHIDEVMKSVVATSISKPFAASIAFQALAKFYVTEESPELELVKAQMLGWIQGWMADSGKVWRKTLLDELAKKGKAK